jgi:RNA exonuclease 1
MELALLTGRHFEHCSWTLFIVVGFRYKLTLGIRVKEHLDLNIQTGGAAGHSSVEDSKATLDLVRWFIVQQEKSKAIPKAQPPQGSSSSSST